jgi:hypothetical protein
MMIVRRLGSHLIFFAALAVFQLDPVLAAAGWRVSHSDHEAVQYCAPVAETLTNRKYPFVAPTIDWYAGEPGHVEAIDFDAKLYRAANVFDLISAPGRRD